MSPVAYQDLQLPSAVDAERVLLGAVLLDNQTWADIAQKLKPFDFSLDSHQRLGKAMKRLMDASAAVDIVTLVNELGHTGELDSVGGVSYIASLTEGLPRRPAIEDYIAIVKDKSLLRQTMTICSQVTARASDQSESALEVIGSALAGLERITDSVGGDDKSGHVTRWISDAADKMVREYTQKTVPCIPSGNAWFDGRAGGYRIGRMSIVAARPKVGKSAWAQQSIAFNCMQAVAKGIKRRVVDFSIEMDRDERARNLVPYVVNIPNRVATKPELQTPEQHQMVLQGLGAIAEWPYSCYDGELDIDQVCWTMNREARHGDEVLFVLDHFGLMTSSEKDIRKRYVENSSRLRRTMKKLHNCALVSLFQLNPVPREYQDKRPVPDDLKESKNPIEDCYAMLLLHRYIDKETLRMTAKANINLALLRGGGAPGSVDCEFDRRKLCFEAAAELDLDDDESYFSK